METIYERLGGADVVLALARAWHARCLADPVVSHAFSHGFHPSTTSGWRRTGARCSAGRRRSRGRSATSPR
ncbi:hypothetical protein PZ938_12020 [Luteipulveratus sp. YIM 133132]|uniref:hypothetical protein n=1 Tax=Luteipulveratus flavus TaxID=3031728 RepID=UPI0023AEC22A|nr:hypothetical protein [Luteipulveratus sp. YIM 133132]MDE9366328.1 hypothetical protein [Luteipulveratus sp. YIM 133132]